MASPHMILTAFFFNPQGDHRVSWRHPRAAGREVFGLDYYRQIALAAERARIDAIFVADHLGVWDAAPSGIAHYANPRLEPITLIAALAAVTSTIGFIATASTSYSEPYNLARMFASIDHISGGRVGWNVVTSALPEEARNFGLDGNIAHATRYERAGEFLHVAKRLWKSWDADAVLLDRDTGVFADPAKVHYLDHAGTHFRVKGPLNVPRSAQGHPVIVQAGSSEAGRDLAAAEADIHFAVIHDEAGGRAYRDDLDARLARRGRVPESLKLLTGVLPIVAASRAEADERQDEMRELMPERLAIDLLSTWAGRDLSMFPPDGPLPELADETNYDGWRTWLALVKDRANEGMSIRDVARRIANTGSMTTVAGTATDVADRLEAWFRDGAVDGFNLMFPLLPEDWMNFMTDVVPLLQRRGCMGAEYGPGTLRDRLSLAP